MMTHGWTRTSKRLLTLLAALALLGLSACGDDANEDNNGTDACAEVTCDAPASVCQGDSVVSYSGAGICDETDGTCDYTAVTETTDCTATGQSCRDGACVSVTDLCENVTCEQLDDTCDGEVAVTYSGPGFCDEATGMCGYNNVETRTDCTESAQVCEDGACVVVDPQTCDDVTCDQPDNTCDGDTAVTYSGEGTCDESDLSCDFSGVETRTDCTETDEICQAGACVPEGTDLCEGVTCDQPTDTCDGNFAVTYTGAGMCDSSDGSCDFAAVETRTDCGITSEICDAGVCVPVGDDHSVNPGDLIITEFLPNPTTVGDGEGEYFEVYNTTDRTLHLNGLTVADDGIDSFEITDANDDPIEVAPQSYFVFGTNADTGVNGGIPVDHEYGSAMTLANGGDEIVIVKDYDTANAEEIARVAYGSGTDFPSKVAGMSSQLGAEHGFDGIDNNDGTLWCHSRDVISGTNSDLGTPGMANVDCAMPAVIVTPQELQDESSSEHPSVGSAVRVEGVTVTFVNDDHAWVQDAAGGPFSGVYLNVGSSDVSGVSLGDVVTVEGTYTETYDVTTIESPTITVDSSGTPLSPEPVLSSDFTNAATAESWEGVLIRIVKPGVTNENPDAPAEYAEFHIDAALRVDDQLFDYPAEVGAPTNCDTFSELSGILHFTHSNYKLLPRDAADFPAPATLAISTDDSVSVSASGVDPEAICVDAGTEVSWSGMGGSFEVIESDPITGLALASPLLSGTAPGFGSFDFTFNDAGTTHYMGEDSGGTAVGTGRVIVLETP